MISVIVPTYNGSSRIRACLDALQNQNFSEDYEIIVVDDGSSDNTKEVVAEYRDILILFQQHLGPARARNKGVESSKGRIIAFTDDDCIPHRDWLEKITAPFVDPDIVGVKGAYETRQKGIISRFVQYEYEEKYRVLCRHRYIDFIDTYSAAFRKDIFIKEGGFSNIFLDAAGEDADFSYRLYKKGYKMVFEPRAKVWHTHPQKLSVYMRKKLRYGRWHMLALKNNPGRIFKDTYRPQIMKLQILAPALLFVAAVGALAGYWSFYMAAALALLFFFSTAPFIISVAVKDKEVSLWAPVLLFCRSCAQLSGVIAGIFVCIGKKKKCTTSG